jgi:phytoene dehydrogenase-like protein
VQRSSTRGAPLHAQHPYFPHAALLTAVHADVIAAPEDTARAGIGGLCCAALLAHYGKRVTVVESHYHPGGAAHAFQVDGYTFDSGPSFHAGLSSSSSPNPLRQVLDIVGEKVACKTYDRWIVYGDRGAFPCVASEAGYHRTIQERGGDAALAQWLELEKAMAPLQAGAALFPAAGMRGDAWVALTAGFFGLRSSLTFAKTGLVAGQLTGPFSNVVDKARNFAVRVLENVF